MTLKHTPAYTTDHPDSFEHEETGRTYSVIHDHDAEDPRTFIEDSKVALWAYREPVLSRSVAADRPDNWIIDAFARFYEQFTDEASLEATRRWLRIFHPEETAITDVGTFSLRGYSQSDWLDVIVVAEKGYGSAEGHAQEFRNWAFGDIWIVVPDQDGESLAGIHAEDSEEALQHYLEQHPPRPMEEDPPILEDAEGTEDSLEATLAAIIAESVADSDELSTSEIVVENISRTSTAQELGVPTLEVSGRIGDHRFDAGIDVQMQNFHSWRNDDPPTSSGDDAGEGDG